MKKALIRLFARAALIVGAFIAGCGNGFADSTQSRDGKSQSRLIDWNYPVAIDTNAPAGVKELAEGLAQQFRFFKHVDRVRQPGCHLFVGLDPRGPDFPGYVIVLESGGGEIRATDLSELKRAIEALQGLMVKDGDRVLLPVPMVVTSYPVKTVK